MRTSIIRTGLAAALVAVAATASLSACSVQVDDKAVPEGKVVVEIDGKKTTYDDGHAITGTGKAISVGVNKSTATVACSGAEQLTLVGTDGAITVSGTCGDVSATGASQKVVLKDAKELSVLGADNTITAGALDALKVTGAGNKITYVSSDSEPELLGANNDVTKK
ncbi:DUF3060 domain-containing protein [Leifsonia poae]|uniref:DUF3060 domain-containing protein n=1 Tax=Leifsonia poae TaxID=110933 RepID=UPI003D69D1A6